MGNPVAVMGNPVTLMAVMASLFMAMFIAISLVRGYRKGIGFIRLAMIAGIGAIFIGFIYMMWIA